MSMYRDNLEKRKLFKQISQRCKKTKIKGKPSTAKVAIDFVTGDGRYRECCQLIQVNHITPTFLRNAGVSNLTFLNIIAPCCFSSNLATPPIPADILPQQYSYFSPEPFMDSNGSTTMVWIQENFDCLSGFDLCANRYE